MTKQPTFYYLIPGYAIAALVNAGALHLALRHDKARRFWLTGGTVAAWLPTIGATLPMTVTYYAQYYITARQDNALLAKAMASGCDVISYYESPAKQYKLIFGTANISLYDHLLAKLYPHFLSYHIWRRRFQTFDLFLYHDAAVRVLEHQKCVYLLGSGIERFGSMGTGLPPSAISLVARTYPPAGMFTAIYKLQPSTGLPWSDIVPPTK